MALTKKRHYPTLALANRAKLSVYLANGSAMFSFLPTRKDAEEAFAWIVQQSVAPPQHHTIENC